MNIFLTKLNTRNLTTTIKRPLSDSETATMYELKGQSQEMQTGQSFKYRELVRPASLSSRPIQLICLCPLHYVYVYCAKHIALCTLQYAHCTVRSAHCTMGIAICKLHYIYWTKHIALQYCISNIASFQMVANWGACKYYLSRFSPILEPPPP